MPEIQCHRCGYKWEVNATRRAVNYCASCRARRVQSIRTDNGPCLPWHGNFAMDFVTPIDEDGNAVMPGVRSCGNADCVNPKHNIS